MWFRLLRGLLLRIVKGLSSSSGRVGNAGFLLILLTCGTSFACVQHQDLRTNGEGMFVMICYDAAALFFLLHGGHCRKGQHPKAPSNQVAMRNTPSPKTTYMRETK